jgi:hypothetical protein
MAHDQTLLIRDRQYSVPDIFLGSVWMHRKIIGIGATGINFQWWNFFVWVEKRDPPPCFFFFQRNSDFYQRKSQKISYDFPLALP